MAFQGKLRPRSVIEEYESRHCTASDRKLNTKAKWAKLFLKNEGDLQTELAKTMPDLVSLLDQSEKASFVGEVAQETYRSLSNYVHTFDSTEEVIINEATLVPRDVQFLKAICKALPVFFKIIYEKP